MEFEEPKSSKKHTSSNHHNHHGNKKITNDEKCIMIFKSQMEYYFSDANLIKDRYLTNLIEKHKRGYVDIVEFLRFNKIKEITSTYNIPFIKILPLLIKGIERSDKLRLNRLNDKVKRKKEFKKTDELEEEMHNKTIYVENLNSHASLSLLNDVFKKFGEIVSINLPKFKNSLNKGYAFIQFADIGSASDALDANNTVPSEICRDVKSAIKPLRVISYAEWNEYKEKFRDLKEKLRYIYTEKKSDKDYTYVRLKLNVPADSLIKDEIKVSFKQIDIETFYIDITDTYEIVVKVWDYSAYQKLENQFKTDNELFSTIVSISPLSDSDFKDYLHKISWKRDKIARTKFSKKIRKTKKK